MKIKRIIDISRTLHPEMMVWPGDEKFKIKKNLSIKAGDIVNLSSLEMSVHTGTHIDAPLHFIDEGLDISSLDLTSFLNFAKVFDLQAESHISKKTLLSLDIDEGDIVILKTLNSYLPEEEEISEKYISLDLSAAEYLIEKKIKTIGVDNLSIDTFNSKTFPIHNLLLSSNIGVIEGLRLKDVREGVYLLSALPLKLTGADGSPARIVLVEFA